MKEEKEVSETQEAAKVEEEVNEVVEEMKEEVISADDESVTINSDDKSINISEDVIASIAGLAAQEVNGVASMSASGIGEVLGRKPKGVKVQSGDKDVVIDITLTTEYGTRIPDVCWEVQNRVKTRVETMTGLSVASVNVHVQGISIPKKRQDIAIEEKTSKEDKED
jgi:uncharacterized alkaline shock family protein YloU